MVFLICETFVKMENNWRKLLYTDKWKTSLYPAYKHTNILERLVSYFNQKYKMSIKIHFVPKFYCESNQIEMEWAFLKDIFRKENDQSTIYKIVTNLILKAREDYTKTETNDRIWSFFENRGNLQ